MQQERKPWDLEEDVNLQRVQMKQFVTMFSCGFPVPLHARQQNKINCCDSRRNRYYMITMLNWCFKIFQ